MIHGSATPARTRIAVAGAGVIGLAHIAAAQKSATCALAAIVDPAPRSVALAARAGVAHYNSLADLFANVRPDGVIVATPNNLHLEHALTCIAAGVPMLLEKPITPTVREALTLVDAADKAGARILVGHHRAHSPIMARAKQLIDEGRLGKLVAIMGSAAFLKPDSYFNDAPWRREIGAGPILANMIHEVHSLRMLCGDIVAVQAISSRATRGFAVEDTVAITLKFANGALGSFMLSDTAACARSWEQTSQENKAYATYPDEDCYLVAGTLGSLSIPTMRLKTFAGDDEPSWYTPLRASVAEVVREDPLALQLEHFGSVVRGEAKPIVSVRDGLQNLRITEAISEAAQSRTVVDITPA